MKARRPVIGWTEFDVKEKSWQILTLDGDTYVKKDLKGNFINTGTGEEKNLHELYPRIRNCADASGYILAKRKRAGMQLYQQPKGKQRIPV